MSGLEIIGGISAVITIIDVSVNVWKAAQKDAKVPDTFRAVAQRLPLLVSTLRTCHDQLKTSQEPLPNDVVVSFSRIVDSCKAKARCLRDIFEETIPGEDASRVERYKKAVQLQGKGKRVEQLVQSISEDTAVLVNYHAVKSVRPDLPGLLQDLINELQNMEPSMSEERSSSRTFNNTNYGGSQNINSGDNTNSGPGNQYIYGGVSTLNHR